MRAFAALLLAASALLAPAAADFDPAMVANAFAAVGDATIHAAAASRGSTGRKLASVSISCPTPSTTALACNDGTQLVSYPGSGGVCMCNCGPTQAMATDSTSGGENAYIPVSGAGSCTAAACTAAYPSFCPANRYVGPLYVDWVTLGNAAQGMLSLTPLNCGSAALCYGVEMVCNSANVNNGNCPTYLAGTTIFAASCWGANVTLGGGAAAQCASAAASSSAALAQSVGAVVCNTNLCNTAGAAAVKSASAVVTPAGAVLALIAAVAAAALV